MTPAKRTLNLTTGRTVCAKTLVADRPLARMRGLLGRNELPVGEGLLLTPAPSIHTAFMRFAIDAVFLDRELQVLRIAPRLPPWRMAFQRRAHAVLELPAGQAAAVGLGVGDRLRLADAPMTVHRVAGRPERQRITAAPPAVRSESSMHVMVLSADRRFREVTCLLLSRRGCSVSSGEGTGMLAERIERDRTEVVVIDAGRSLSAAARIAAAVEALSRPVGIVIVGDQPQSTLLKLQTIPKWGSFDMLFSAVQEAHASREHRHALLDQGVRS